MNCSRFCHRLKIQQLYSLTSGNVLRILLGFVASFWWWWDSFMFPYFALGFQNYYSFLSISAQIWGWSSYYEDVFWRRWGGRFDGRAVSAWKRWRLDVTHWGSNEGIAEGHHREILSYLPWGTCLRLRDKGIITLTEKETDKMATATDGIIVSLQYEDLHTHIGLGPCQCEHTITQITFVLWLFFFCPREYQQFGLMMIVYASQTPRTEWVLQWPGQVVIAGCQTEWTTDVSKALEEKDLPGVYEKLLGQLDDLRNLVRSPLTKIGRMILSALIVIEVHARDVVHKMVDEKVENINDFEWISQLRFAILLHAL